jgi:hypothetical protein
MAMIIGGAMLAHLNAIVAMTASNSFHFDAREKDAGAPSPARLDNLKVRSFRSPNAE